MKTIIQTLITTFFCTICFSQEKPVDTDACTIESFTNYIAETYKTSENLEEMVDSPKIKNIVLLIQLNGTDLSVEEKIILKQSFRFLSRRLLESDRISILAFSHQNGIILRQQSPKELKSILYALENLPKLIEKSKKDGMDHGYDYMNEIYNEEAENKMVIVRNTNPVEPVSKNITNKVDEPKNKQKNQAVLLTALGLLPEILAIIKD